MRVIITTVERGAMRADSMHVRHAIVEVQCVNVVIGVVHVVLLVVRVVPIFVCDAVVHRTCSHISRSHFSRMFCCIGGIVCTRNPLQQRK